MQGNALKYMLVESTGSGIVNGLLNFAAAYLLFRGRTLIPASGPVGLVRDSIGETFLVVSLSYMVAALISRQRRRAGTLPARPGAMRAPARGNIYLWSFGLGLVFTCVFVPLNALLLPRVSPNGFTLTQVILFKTIFGAVLGSIATLLAVNKALNEVHPRQQSGTS